MYELGAVVPVRAVGPQVLAHVDGTLDKRDDVDKGWVVEMQIPLEAAKGMEKTMKGVPPALGTAWRVNFFRMDMPGGKVQQASAWSPPLVGDFHALDKFGTLVFGDEKGDYPGATPPAKTEPPKPANNVAPVQAQPAAPPAAANTQPSDPNAKPMKINLMQRGRFGNAFKVNDARKPPMERSKALQSKP